MSTAWRIGLLCFVALFVLQPVWHLWLAPAHNFDPPVITALALTPLLPPAIGLLLRRPNALFWAGFLSLLHFCHGVMEAWTSPDVRWLALLEVALSVGLSLGVGIDGIQHLKARKAARLAASQRGAEPV
jgi:uncharacterized membrane protein